MPLKDFVVEDNVSLTCDIVPIPEYGENVIGYECRFQKRIDPLQAKRTAPLPILAHINVKQKKMKRNSNSDFMITAVVNEDSASLGSFSLDLKAGMKCSTRRSSLIGTILDCE